MLKNISLSRPMNTHLASRGRNRWFQAARIEVWEKAVGIPQNEHVSISVYSARAGRTAPIIVGLTYEDAEALGSELLKMVLTRADVMHRTAAIRALRSILAKLEGEDYGETRPLIRDREDPHAHQVTGLDR
jgi:hypothetical protein